MFKKIYIGLILFFCIQNLVAQSFTDGLMMPKNAVCAGFAFGQEKFGSYWEGTLLRTSPVGNQTISSTNFFANVGIKKNFNALVNVAYMANTADKTAIAGMSGLQDITLGLKYKLPIKGNVSAIFVGGGTLPLTNYVAAYPFAIGNQCKTAFGKLMLQYFDEVKGWDFSIQSGYTLRSNIKIDAPDYYTDQFVSSNEVSIPDALQHQIRGGYCTYRFILEAVGTQFQTLGGFDIRRQDMPFPSNKQESTRVGVFSAYRIKSLADVQVMGSIMYAVAGRNTGQSLTYSFGLFKNFGFTKEAMQSCKAADHQSPMPPPVDMFPSPKKN